MISGMDSTPKSIAGKLIHQGDHGIQPKEFSLSLWKVPGTREENHAGCPLITISWSYFVGGYNTKNINKNVTTKTKNFKDDWLLNNDFVSLHGSTILSLLKKIFTTIHFLKWFKTFIAFTPFTDVMPKKSNLYKRCLKDLLIDLLRRETLSHTK